MDLKSSNILLTASGCAKIGGEHPAPARRPPRRLAAAARRPPARPCPPRRRGLLADPAGHLPVRFAAAGDLGLVRWRPCCPPGGLGCSGRHACTRRAERRGAEGQCRVCPLVSRRVAPEVLMGGKQCTQAVDIFSFGVVLWVSSAWHLRVQQWLPSTRRWQRQNGRRWQQPCPRSGLCLLALASAPQPASCAARLQEIATGERPQRGHLRPPRVPEECPRVRQRRAPARAARSAAWPCTANTSAAPLCPAGGCRPHCRLPAGGPGCAAHRPRPDAAAQRPGWAARQRRQRGTRWMSAAMAWLPVAWPYINPSSAPSHFLHPCQCHCDQHTVALTSVQHK